MLDTRFQAPEETVSEEIFDYFSMFFYSSNPEPHWGWGPVKPLDIHLNKLGKGHRGHATHLISSI